MFKKQKFSKIYLASFFLLLIIISIFAALIFEKTTKDNNQKIITLNLDTKVEENLSWNFSTINNSMEVIIGQLYKIDFNVENYGSMKLSGKAIYDVSPKLLKKYFVEIDCFCYKKTTPEYLLLLYNTKKILWLKDYLANNGLVFYQTMTFGSILQR